MVSIIFIKHILISILIAFSALAAPTVAMSDVVVIAHPNTDLAPLDRKSIKRIFTLKQSRWDDGSKIKLFVLPKDSQAHIDLCRKFLRLTPRQLANKWSRVTYTGHGSLPKIVDDETELFNSVISTPNAIGYVSKAFLSHHSKDRDRYVMPFKQ